MFTRKYYSLLTMLLVISGIFLTLIVAGSLISGHAQTPLKPVGELRIGVSSLLTQTFHPFLAPYARKFYYEVMFDHLVGVNEKGEPSPEHSIAFKWEEASDHLSWTFYIRDGVKFHDGTPLTLDDVKYSIDTILDEKNVCARSLHIPYQDRVEIVPPNKVVVHMKKPWPIMHYLLGPLGQGGGVILPKKYIEEKGTRYFETNPIGTGPYRFLEQKEADYIKFVAQDHHWRVGTPKYKNLTFKAIPEEETRVANLIRGELDIITVSIAKSKELEKRGFPIRSKHGAVDLFLEFLRTYEPTNPLHKKEVRQALIYAIEKAAILENILLGRGKLIGHAPYMFSGSIGYKEYPVTPYDPKKAKELLAKAGYPEGFTIYLYSYVTTVPEQELINEAIAGYWEAIGMKVKILKMESGAFMPIWTKKKEPPGPAAHMHSWSDRPQATWRPIYHSDVKKFYFSQTADPEMDRLIEEFDKQITLKGYIEATRKCVEHVLANFYKSGVANTSLLFATNKETPEWEIGRGIDSYRFEYIGAKK